MGGYPDAAGLRVVAAGEKPWAKGKPAAVPGRLGAEASAPPLAVSYALAQGGVSVLAAQHLERNDDG